MSSEKMIRASLERLDRTKMMQTTAFPQRGTTKRQGWSAGRMLALLLLLAGFVAGNGLLRAQTTATISGTVHDTSGAVVPKAKVTLTDEASKAVRSTVSGGEGHFTFPSVQPGAIYELKITAKGFSEWMVGGIEVHPGDRLSIDKIALVIGEVSESVVVTADVAGITLTSPEHSALITSDTIDRMSTVGRDVSELVRTLPGFTLNAGSSVQNQAPDYEVMGFGNGGLSNYGANGAAPQGGFVSVVTDSANVMDPGDMGGQMMNVNAEQVQEVKVQTSNFGADEAKGPVVINAVGKSGGDNYHGTVYTNLRNAAFNANDWLSNYYGTERPNNRFVYPGATLGGPVKIPGTHFNHSKKLTFWTGFEYYKQTSVSSLVQDFIPTADMLGGNLSADSIASALNVDSATLTSQCTADYSTGTFQNVGGICAVPSGTDQNGNTISNGQIAASSIESSFVKAYTRFYPKTNRTPKAMAADDEPTDGFNYVKNVMASNDGFQIHGRLDENFSDNLKLYLTYNYESVNGESPLNNMYYNPTNVVPYPTPFYSHAHSHVLAVNLTRVFTPTLSNEFVTSGAYFYQPGQFADPSLVQDENTDFPYPGGLLANGTTQLPAIVNYEIGVPSFAMANVPKDSLYLRKYSFNVQDTISKQLRSHSLRFGGYAEMTANNQVATGNYAMGEFVFARWDYCKTNWQSSDSSAAAKTMTLGNGVANFLTGCAASYSQNSADLATDLNFKSWSFFGTDEWKVNSRLTLTYGVRFEHMGPWTDAHGIGLAVWNPTAAYAGLQTIDQNDPTTWPGINWHKHPGSLGSVPLSGAPSTAIFISPRAGLSFDAYGNGKTVIRGGWGAYRAHDSYNLSAGAGNVTAGIRSYSTQGTYGCTLEQLFDPSAEFVPSQGGVATGSCSTSYTNGSSSSSAGQFAVTALDPKDKNQPVTYNYNLTLDQVLPWGMAFEVAYSGNQSAHLATLSSSTGADVENQNVVPLGAGFHPDPITGQIYDPNNMTTAEWADFRPYPNYTKVDVPKHISWANYNALQTSLSKQAGSLIMNVNYSWAKALGVRGNYDTGYNADPINLQNDYGILAYNRAQAMNLSFSYQEGKKYHGSNVVLRQSLNDWELSGIMTMQSGPDMAIINGTPNFSMSASVGVNGLSYGTVDWLGTPDYVLMPIVTCNPGANLHSKSSGAKQFINGTCFKLPEVGSQGQYKMPDVHGPAFFNADLTVFKNFKLGEGKKLQFRMAGFNFMNHPLTSFNNQDTSNINLIFQDPSGSAYTTFADAAANAVPNSTTFGYTGYKSGTIANGPGRIVEFGLKYTF